MVELLNLVTEKFNPIFGPNFRGGLKNFGRNTYFNFFLNDDLPKYPDTIKFYIANIKDVEEDETNFSIDFYLHEYS